MLTATQIKDTYFEATMSQILEPVSVSVLRSAFPTSSDAEFGAACYDLFLTDETACFYHEDRPDMRAELGFAVEFHGAPKHWLKITR